MNKNNLSPFYEEWTRILKSDLQKRAELKETDPSSACVYLNQAAASFSDDPPSSLEEAIGSYKKAFSQNHSLHLEKALMDCFPPKEFINFERYYPRIYRGLPRLYNANCPAQSQTKKHFTNLENLKRQAASKALFSLYERFSPKGVVTLFTWVISDGLGDYMAVKQLLAILRSSFPDLTLRAVLLIEKKVFDKIQTEKEMLTIGYEEEPLLNLIPPDVLEILRNSDLILQLPTFFSKTADLWEALCKIPSEQPLPKMERVGEYGFLESSWFHPNSGGYSMGLHFLEKGVLTFSCSSKSWDDVQNEQIQRWRKPENRFYLAYLTSVTGGAIYLHALLKSLENEPEDIDICLPDLDWLVRYAEERQKEGLPILEWNLGVKSIELRYRGELYVLSIGSEGKAVRLLAPDTISSSDFEALLYLSSDFVAVRGNQSFSEAISQGKPFFYDGRMHSRYFFKDLVALAENRLKGYPGTLRCIRAMYQGFLHQLPLQTDPLVDETFFQPLEKWSSLAEDIGKALQDPATFTGFQKLGKMIKEEFSANRFLCHLVQRALCHQKFPETLQKEEMGMRAFLSNTHSFSQTLQSLQNDLFMNLALE